MERYITDHELYKKGEDVFETLDNFHERLNTEASKLDNQAPITFLATTKGRQQIYDLLINIAYGNLA